VFQANLKPNQYFPMMSFEIHLEDIDMVMLEEVPKDAFKAFEEHRRAAEERRRATEAKEL
jgi:isocitrate/isopropylmalate dehydrogenase